MGWEPKQTHRGYDREGRQVALAEAFEVVVTTEAEWNDDQRDRAAALVLYRSQVCACGHHESLTTPENGFMPTTRVCPVCAAGDQYGRIQRDSDERKHGKNPKPGRRDPADGRRTYMRLLSQQEKADAEAKAAKRGGARGDSE